MNAMEDQSAKADGGKSNPLLLEADLAGALSVINRVLDYGLVKYERKSWMKVQMERWDAACRRHRRARDCGELVDAESGLLHMAHEATGLIIQMQLYMDANPGTDFHTCKAPPQDHKYAGTDEGIPLGGVVERRVRAAVEDDINVRSAEANHRRDVQHYFGLGAL